MGRDGVWCPLAALPPGAGAPLSPAALGGHSGAGPPITEPEPGLSPGERGFELLLLVPKGEEEVASRTSWGISVGVGILPVDPLLYLQPALLGSTVGTLITSRHPDLVLFTADRRGGNLAAAVAATLGCGLCAHVDGIEVGTGSSPVYLVPSYGGRARMTSSGPYQMATVGARFAAAPLDRFAGTRSGLGMVAVLPPVEGAAAVQVWECLPLATEQDTLASDRVYPLVVGAGWGVGDRQGFELVKALAHTLGAPLVVTRPVVDEGWAPVDVLVGQSGKRIRCRVYLAVGLSGDPQHMVGVDADTIVAINVDPRAPIYGHARLGVARDFRELVPALLTALQTRA